MDREVKTIGIQKREFAMQLIKLGYEILNVLPSKQNKGGLAYIFEKTEDLENEFQRIIRENHFIKQLHGLTLYDIRTLQGLLSGYDIAEDDKFRIMEILTDIDNDICGYNVPNEIPNVVTEVIQEEIIEEPVVELDVSELKQAMSGSKDYSKFDVAYGKAVNKNRG